MIRSEKRFSRPNGNAKEFTYVLYQVTFVSPFGMSELECRVVRIKKVILQEMNEDDARDMRNYNLEKRRNALCKSLLKPHEKKAATTMGILECSAHAYYTEAS